MRQFRPPGSGLPLKREGIVMNHKKLRRLYREERLQVRRRSGRKRALGTRVPMVLPQGSPDQAGMVARGPAANRSICCDARRGVRSGFVWRGMNLSPILVAREDRCAQKRDVR